MNSRVRFLSACKCLPVDRPPVWLMRQAGRYLPEYRLIREQNDFLKICRTPELIFEVSMQPWHRFHMDAVIVFSDILLPIAAMGTKVTFEENLGPRLDSKITTILDVKKLSIPSPMVSFPFLLESLTNLRHELKEETALIGFVGGPWTLAAYAVEGGTGSFSSILNLLKASPDVVLALLNKFSDAILPLAIEQINAGADCIQIFDTWAGLLTRNEYHEYILPVIKKIISEIHKKKVPVILYIRDSSHLIEEMILTEADVISIGSDTNLEDTLKLASSRVAVQGNLDPEILFKPSIIVERETKKMLLQAKGKNGYIANLGRGVLPQTKPENVQIFVNTVLT